jgi:enoyl-CoA hydratase/carnithine racemase
MLELFLHCHHLVAADNVGLGFPEVTLPVIPGMEGCHWPLCKARREDWPKVLDLLLGGKPVRAAQAKGWLVDVAAPLEEALAAAWDFAHGGAERRRVEGDAIRDVASALPAFAETGDSGDAARRAIWETVVASASVPLGEALDVQSRRSAAFMTSKPCRGGVVGSAAAKQA